MLTTLITGILLTALALAALWIGFRWLRQLSRFSGLISRQANKRMLQLTLLIYFSGLVLTIYFMLN